MVFSIEVHHGGHVVHPVWNYVSGDVTLLADIDVEKQLYFEFVCMYVCMYVCKFVMHLINSCSLQMATLATYFGLGRQTHRYYLFANMQAILSYVEFLFADICCYGYSGAWMMFG